jgi:hypothetical protein
MSVGKKKAQDKKAGGATTSPATPRSRCGNQEQRRRHGAVASAQARSTRDTRSTIRAPQPNLSTSPQPSNRCLGKALKVNTNHRGEDDSGFAAFQRKRRARRGRRGLRQRKQRPRATDFQFAKLNLSSRRGTIVFTVAANGTRQRTARSPKMNDSAAEPTVLELRFQTPGREAISWQR